MFCFLQGLQVRENSKRLLSRRSARSIHSNLGTSLHPEPPENLSLNASEKCNDNDSSISNSLSRSTPSTTINLSTKSPTKISPKSTNSSRQKKFQQHFDQINSKELLINSYSCALVGDIPFQGHLFITANYFAFYSSVFGHVTKLLIPIASVKNITKEKTARIIPNVIAVETENERHVFGSLMSRDSIFKLMNQVWEAVLKEKVEINFPILMEPESLPPNVRLQTVCTNDMDKVIMTDSVESNLTSSRLREMTSIQGTVFSKKEGILKSLVKHHPRPTTIIAILIVFLAALYVSAGLMMLRIDKLHNAYLNHPFVYPQKATHDRMLHYLNTNLDQIVKVRESLQTLSEHFSTISRDFDENQTKPAAEPS